jgi:hypothetical protein
LEDIEGGNFPGRDIKTLAGAEKLVRIVRRIFGESDEEPSACLDARGGYFFQEEIFGNALPARIGIIYGIPGPTVQEAMVSPGGPAREPLFL